MSAAFIHFFSPSALKQICVVVLLAACLQTALGQYRPARDLGDLFRDVQLSGIFPDSKTFPDAVPKVPVEQILQKYEEQDELSKTELRQFVEEHFTLPRAQGTPTTRRLPIGPHIDSLWDELVRRDTPTAGSRIVLPYPYVVPGGRFNEMYYWDSYFTMLGLAEAGKNNLIRSMIKNFAWMIDEYGFVPNGARSYYLTRSQPPFFAMMVEMLARIDGDSIYAKYLPQLRQEYDHWMRGADKVGADRQAYQNVVWLNNGVVLNRYWDNDSAPRPEAYKEDIATAEKSARPAGTVYRHIRAACESGWDFSSRWLADGLSLHTIRTANLVPVDLNSLLYHLELVLAKAYKINGRMTEAESYQAKAQRRRAALLDYCWNSDAGFFMDFDFTLNQTTGVHSLAAMYPLFYNIADQEQASAVAKKFAAHFLFSGGAPATLCITDQQWDAPNGWAPLQWISYKALKNYGFDDIADTLRTRWIATIREEYTHSGKLVEKYNVLHPVPGGGGEYPTQDGFGWTNGVYLKMLREGEGAN